MRTLAIFAAIVIGLGAATGYYLNHQTETQTGKQHVDEEDKAEQQGKPAEPEVKPDQPKEPETPVTKPPAAPPKRPGPGIHGGFPKVKPPKPPTVEIPLENPRVAKLIEELTDPQKTVSIRRSWAEEELKKRGINIPDNER